MKKYIFAFIVMLFFGGCSPAKHMDELLTLKRLSNEQKEIELSVNEQDGRFEKMLESVGTREWEQYKSKDMFLASFGDPVLKEELVADGHVYEKWVYRRATEYFHTAKIYLVFDETEALVDYQLIRPSQ